MLSLQRDQEDGKSQLGQQSTDSRGLEVLNWQGSMQLGMGWAGLAGAIRGSE